jgi:hypothetical protein
MSIVYRCRLTPGHGPTTQQLSLKFAVTILPRLPLYMSAGAEASKLWIELQLYTKSINFTWDTRLLSIMSDITHSLEYRFDMYQL